MNKEVVRALFTKLLGHEKLDIPTRDQIVESLVEKFEEWFMQAEGQDKLASFEKSLVKTAFAWLVDSVIIE